MWIVRQYQETGRFFRKKLLKLFLILCICFAGLCVLSGIWLASEEALLNEFVQQIAAGFEEKGLFDEGGISFFTLLLNNLYAAGISILIGCIPFFFLTILPAFFQRGGVGCDGSTLPDHRHRDGGVFDWDLASRHFGTSGPSGFLCPWPVSMLDALLQNLPTTGALVPASAQRGGACLSADRRAASPGGGGDRNLCDPCTDGAMFRRIGKYFRNGYP